MHMDTQLYAHRGSGGLKGTCGWEVRHQGAPKSDVNTPLPSVAAFMADANKPSDSTCTDKQ